MKVYKTAGKQKLLSFLQSHPDQQFTVEQIGGGLSATAAATAAATETATAAEADTPTSSLYRQLAALCADGTVRKFRAEGQSAFVYQYIGKTDCSHHFHLKCMACGRLIHLQCGMSDELISHIQADHGFRVDSGRSILYGFCADCTGRASAEGLV